MAGVGPMATSIRGELAMKTSGRVVVITGGFGALGQIVAAAALGHGFSVAVLGHTAEPPAGLTKRPEPNALLPGGVDLADEVAAMTPTGAVPPRVGRIHPLFELAGVVDGV